MWEEHNAVTNASEPEGGGGPSLPCPSFPSPCLISLPPSPLCFPSLFFFFFPPNIVYKENSSSTLARRTAVGDCSLPEPSFQKFFTPAQIGFTNSFSITGPGNSRNSYNTFKLEADLHACGRWGKGENAVSLGQHFRVLRPCWEEPSAVGVSNLFSNPKMIVIFSLKLFCVYTNKSSSDLFFLK